MQRADLVLVHHLYVRYVLQRWQGEGWWWRSCWMAVGGFWHQRDFPFFTWGKLRWTEGEFRGVVTSWGREARRGRAARSGGLGKRSVWVLLGEPLGVGVPPR